MLVEEMKGLGIADAKSGRQRDMYMDTSLQLLDAKTSRRLVWLRIWTTVADASGENIKPQIIENYDGRTLS